MSTLFQGFLGFLGRKGRRWAAQDGLPGKPNLESYRTAEWIPLSEAARLMYEELDGTLWRTAADREHSPEAGLDYLAIHLARNAPIEGRTPPSSSFRRIPSSEFDSGIFKGGGKYFQRHYESYLTFIDMRVREQDLRDALAKMKAGE